MKISYSTHDQERHLKRRDDTVSKENVKHERDEGEWRTIVESPTSESDFR